MSGFSSNIDHLETIGNEKLPTAIDNIDVAIRKIHKARDESDGAFYGDSDIFHEVGRYFYNNSGDLRDSMDKNKSTLKLGQEAILEIAERYRAVDGRD